MALSSIDSVLFALKDANGNVTSIVAATSDSGYVFDTRIGGTGTSANDVVFRVSAVGSLTASAGVDPDGVTRIDISGAPPGGAASNTIDYSAVYLEGTFAGDAAVTASAVGAGFTLSAGPNIKLFGNNTTKVISVSGAEPGAAESTFDFSSIARIGVTLPDSAAQLLSENAGDQFVVCAAGNLGIHLNNTSKIVTLSASPDSNASSFGGSAISTSVTAIPGSVLAWAGAPGWQASTITYPVNNWDFSSIAKDGVVLPNSNAQLLSENAGDQFTVCAAGNLAVHIHDGVKTLTLSASPDANASSIGGSALDESVTAIPGNVLAWAGIAGWQASTLTYPAAAPSGSYATASSLGTTHSSINSSVTALPGDVLAWAGAVGWQASTLTLENNWDFSSIARNGIVAPGSDSQLQAANAGDLYTVCAIGNMNIHLHNNAKVLTLSANTKANASSIEGSAINTGVTATLGMVLTWAGAPGWQASTISYPVGGGGLNNVVEDTTPQLGGNLDTQNFNISSTDPTSELRLSHVSSTILSSIDSSSVRLRAANASAIDLSSTRSRSLSGTLRYLRVGNDFSDSQVGTPLPYHWAQVTIDADATFGSTGETNFSGGNAGGFKTNDAVSSTIGWVGDGTETAHFIVHRPGYYKIESYGAIAWTSVTTGSGILRVYVNETSGAWAMRFGGNNAVDPHPYAISLMLNLIADDTVELKLTGSQILKFTYGSHFRIEFCGDTIT